MASGTKGSPGDLGPTFSQSAAVRVNETIPARQAGAKRMKPDVVMRRGGSPGVSFANIDIPARGHAG
jgi:hypothetical protein